MTCATSRPTSACLRMGRAPRTTIRAVANKDRLTGLDSSFLHLERDSAHMHVAGCSVFDGEAPGLRGADRSDRVAAAPRAALPPAARLRPVRPGTAGVGGRPPLQRALPRPAHGAAPPRRRRRAQAAGRTGVLAGARPQPSAVGAVAGRRPGRGTASRCSPRPTMRWSTASPAWTSRPCCSTPRRIRCRWRPPEHAWVARPLPSRGPAAGRRAARARHRPGRGGARSPGDAPRPAARWRHALGRGARERRRAGLDRTAGRAAQPVQRADRSAPAVHLGRGRPRSSSRRSRTRSAAPSTTSCSRRWRARSAATCGFTASRPTDVGLRAMVPGLGPRRHRARRARQPGGRDVGDATGRDHRSGRSGCRRSAHEMQDVKQSGQAVGAEILTQPVRLRPADDHGPGGAAPGPPATVQPRRDQRARTAVPAVPAGSRARGDLPDGAAGREHRARDRDPQLQRAAELRAGGRLRRAGRRRGAGRRAALLDRGARGGGRRAGAGTAADGQRRPRRPARGHAPRGDAEQPAKAGAGSRSRGWAGCSSAWRSCSPRWRCRSG